MKIQELVPYLGKKQIKECLTSDAIIVPYNTYSRIFPNRTTFRSFEIDLAKWLSQQGYKVATPKLNIKHKKQLILQKHFDLTNPLMLFILSIPFQLIISIIGGFIVHLATKRSAKPSIIIIKLNRNGDVEQCIDEAGQSIAQDEVKTIADNLQETPDFTRPEPSDLPVPIHLEHTSEVVGRAEIWQDDRGILVGKCRIDDDVTLSRIKSGELVGFSIGGIATEYECSICHQDFFTCPHIKGQNYDGEEAIGIVKSLDLAEISIVSDPTNVDCRFQDIDIQNK